MSRFNLDKRAHKIEARRVIIQTLQREHAITRGAVTVCLGLLQRGLFGRLKWLLLGR